MKNTLFLTISLLSIPALYAAYNQPSQPRERRFKTVCPGTPAQQLTAGAVLYVTAAVSGIECAEQAKQGSVDPKIATFFGSSLIASAIFCAEGLAGLGCCSRDRRD